MPSEKSRQMVPGRDTVERLARAYGLKPSKARDIIRVAGVDLIREDGYRGKLVMVDTREAVVSARTGRATKVVGWEDGHLGVDTATTKLTKAAIKAVGAWVWEHYDQHMASLGITV